MNKQVRADLLLIVYSFIMGVTALVLKIGVQELPVYSFLSLRFTLAFLACLLVFWKQWRAKLSRAVLIHSALVGIVTFYAHVTCTTGISLTPVGVAGFLTCLQPVMIPLFSLLFLGKRFSSHTTFCIVGAFISIALITLGNSLELNAGVFICIASSALAAGQVLLIEKYVREGDDPISLTVWQLAVMALCALISAGFDGGVTFPQSPTGVFCIVWTAVISTAIATYIQTYAQQYTSAVHTGIIFASIPIFTLIGSRIVFNESFSFRAGLGALFLVLCIVFMELGHSGKKE